MRESDEFSDEEYRLEERKTEIKDTEKHLLTTDERDEIIRSYNSEHYEKPRDSDTVELKSEEKLPREDRGHIIRKYNAEHSEKLKISDKAESQMDVDSEEVRRLYLEDGLSLKKIGDKYGFKSGKPIKRILKAKGIEIRPVGFQAIEIDPEEAYRLYFDEKWDLKDVAAHFGCKTTTSLRRVFEEHGWKTRYQETYEKVIDPEEVFRLYNEEGLSLRKIGEHFGVSYHPIRQIFKEHDKPYGQEIQIDPEIIRFLYFEKRLPKDEVCNRLGISKKPFDRILEEQGWDARPVGFQSLEIDLDEFKRLYYDEELTLDDISKQLEVSITTLCRFREEHGLEIRDKASIRELRDRIFGKMCVTCGKPRAVIHKKDGVPHPVEILWRKKDLLTLNPEDWAALCKPCHRITHSLMKNYRCEWSKIEIALKELARNGAS
ncbi:hypothetical protein EU527_06260 [Candidatus Thorarchaeota archaeon]|nr:MAG: hypothetical protein EU527_06260 [Candidatus Thorarchaeota archaeon]